MKLTWKQIILTCLGISVLPVAFFNALHYFTGQSNYKNTEEYYTFWEHIGLDMSFSFLVTFSICVTTFRSFPIFERKLPWDSTPAIKRVVIELLYITFVAGGIIAGVTLIYYHSFYSWDTEINLNAVLFTNVATAVIITIVTSSIYEAVMFFRSWKKSVITAEQLAKENIQSQFQSLKNQVNPHFLFNSLNALSSLVHTDPDKAEQFIDEFARIYRYVLDVKERNVVELKEELRFLESFMFLQQIRFGDHLQMQLEIDAAQLHDFLPPLALQELIENAIKHNEVSGVRPLKVSISSEKGWLTVSNPLQPRKEEVQSTGTGLKNLRERYHLFADKTPEFKSNGKSYTARLPLIEAE